jgi:hypothetical protein
MVTSPQSLKRPPPLHFFFFDSQYEIARKSSLSFWRMSIRFARNVKRQRPTEASMSALVTTVYPLGADAMEGLGMSRMVVATAVSMGSTRAGTIEVRSWPLLHGVITNIRNRILGGWEQ